MGRSRLLFAAMMLAGLVFCMAGCGKKETPPPETEPAESTPAEPEGDAKERSAATAPIVEDARNAVSKAADETAEGLKKDVVQPAQELLKKAEADAIGTARELAKADVEAVVKETVEKATKDIKEGVDELQANLQQKPDAGATGADPAGFADALKGAAQTVDAAAMTKDLQRISQVIAKSVAGLPDVTKAEKPPVIAFVEIANAPAATGEAIRGMVITEAAGKFVLLDKPKSEQAVKAAEEADYILTAEAKTDAKGAVTIYQWRLKAAKDGRSVWAYDSKVSRPAETELLKKLPGTDMFGK